MRLRTEFDPVLAQHGRAGAGLASTFVGTFLGAMVLGRLVPDHRVLRIRHHDPVGTGGDGFPGQPALSPPLVERFERKFLVVAVVIAMAVFGPAFGFSCTVISNVFSNANHRYQAEIMPFVLLPVLAEAGPGAVFGVVGAAMAIVALDLGLLGSRTTGPTVESVTARPAEPYGPGPTTRCAQNANSR